ncbi:STAS domain-containing protein [Aneurinibacillus tyrosinisolvens]|uniref:STAS domain-containing protein n=1 Tax=Aneurinibacillus tyrosinisolvens TaxID=1443435 RepID=UPI00063F470F|nr:STAS domain-containing protein [Aneurinibacillus tyrosinisolvens]
MENELQFLGEKILERRYEIAKRVHENRLAAASEEEKQQIAHVEEDIIKIRAGFIGLFGETLKEKLDDEKAFEKILSWGKETGEFIYHLGIPLDEALLDTSFYRTFIWKAIHEEVNEQNISVDTVFEVLSVIDPLLDKAVYSFSLTYVHFHQATLEKANRAFFELSVPVVPLTKGVAILPLIGNVDTERAKLLMEETLKEAANRKLSHLILDLSGVLIVDTMVADQLFKIISALTLVGVKTILTGIRPGVAQTMVSLGLDFNDLTIKANLQQALSDLHKVEKIF